MEYETFLKLSVEERQEFIDKSLDSVLVPVGQIYHFEGGRRRISKATVCGIPATELPVITTNPDEVTCDVCIEARAR